MDSTEGGRIVKLPFLHRIANPTGTPRETNGNTATVAKKTYTRPADPFGFEGHKAGTNRVRLLKSEGEGAWVIRFANNPNSGDYSKDCTFRDLIENYLERSRIGIECICPANRVPHSPQVGAFDRGKELTTPVNSSSSSSAKACSTTRITRANHSGLACSHSTLGFLDGLWFQLTPTVGRTLAPPGRHASCRAGTGATRSRPPAPSRSAS